MSIDMSTLHDPSQHPMESSEEEYPGFESPLTPSPTSSCSIRPAERDTLRNMDTAILPAPSTPAQTASEEDTPSYSSLYPDDTLSVQRAGPLHLEYENTPEFPMQQPRRLARHRRFVSSTSVLTTTSNTTSTSVLTTTSNTTGTNGLHPTQTRTSSNDSVSVDCSSPRRLLGGLLPHQKNSSISLLSGFSILNGNSVDASRSTSQPAKHQRTISAPLSIRRLQFAAPSNGFSDEQMAFLASVESLDKYGVFITDSPEGGSNGALDAPYALPSFEQLARHREECQQNNITFSHPRPGPSLTQAEIQARRQQASYTSS